MNTPSSTMIRGGRVKTIDGAQVEIHGVRFFFMSEAMRRWTVALRKRGLEQAKAS